MNYNLLIENKHLVYSNIEKTICVSLEVPIIPQSLRIFFKIRNKEFIKISYLKCVSTDLDNGELLLEGKIGCNYDVNVKGEIDLRNGSLVLQFQNENEVKDIGEIEIIYSTFKIQMELS